MLALKSWDIDLLILLFTNKKLHETFHFQVQSSPILHQHEKIPVEYFFWSRITVCKKALQVPVDKGQMCLYSFRFQ